MGTEEQIESLAKRQGVEIDSGLLTSFTMVNEGLASNEVVVQAMRRRAIDVGNHNDVDLVAALSDPSNKDLTSQANDDAIDAILQDLGLQDR